MLLILLTNFFTFVYLFNLKNIGTKLIQLQDSYKSTIYATNFWKLFSKIIEIYYNYRKIKK